MIGSTFIASSIEFLVEVIIDDRSFKFKQLVFSVSVLLSSNLKNCIPPPLSHIKNSYHFFKKIDKTKIPNNHIMISLDVSSLFTNVPLNLVIVSLDKNYHKIHNNCKFPFTEIIDAIKFLYNNTYVTFNSVIYTQL